MPGLKLIFLIVHIVIFFAGSAVAQSWELATDEDGIKVYTRPEPGSNFKAFKGEVLLDAGPEEICDILENVELFDEWDEDVSEIRVISREKRKHINYYVIYDTPWPTQDRDLCVSARIMDDGSSGKMFFESSSLPELVPIDENYIRIMEYRQKWIIEPAGDGKVLLTVEGYADPAGSIPAWIANMAITKTPRNMLKSIRETLAGNE